MDTGLTIKAATGVVPADHARPAPVHVQQAVPTDLFPAKAVTVAPEVAAQHAAQQSAYTHDIILDPQSREVIYRVIDKRTHQVLWQVPDQALLRSQEHTSELQSPVHLVC